MLVSVQEDKRLKLTSGGWVFVSMPEDKRSRFVSLERLEWFSRFEPSLEAVPDTVSLLQTPPPPAS